MEASQKSKSTKRYPPELKQRAVRMVLVAREHDPQDQGCVARIARQLGVGDQSLRNWVNHAETDRGKRAGLTTEERERLKALEKENRELKRSADIEASIGFLCGGARPPTEVMVRFIDQNRDDLGVEPICKELQVAPSTY